MNRLGDPVTPAIIADLRLLRAARHFVEQLGSRPAVELVVSLVELARDRAAAQAMVERFAQLEPAALRITGADRFPPAPIRAVSS